MCGAKERDNVNIQLQGVHFLLTLTSHVDENIVLATRGWPCLAN